MAHADKEVSVLPKDIDTLLSGDRREIDRTILTVMHELTETLNSHVQDEAMFLEKVRQLGGEQAIFNRARFVDSLIVVSETRSVMMRKVSESMLIWTAIAFVGFLSMVLWEYVKKVIKE